MLAMVLAMLVYAPVALGATRPVHFLVVRWLLVGILAIWALRLGVGRTVGLSIPLNAAFLLLFVVYAWIRYEMADVTYVAREEWLRILVYGLFFLAIANNLRRPIHGKTVGLILVFLGASLSFYAIYQYATDSEFIWTTPKPAQYVKRGSGTYINPNHLAGFLAMVWPLGMIFIVTGWFRPLMKIALGYCVLVIGAGLFVTVSRGGWIAAGAGMGGFLFWWAWTRKQRVLSWVLLLLMVSVPIVLIAKTQLSRDRVSGSGWMVQIQDVRRILWPAGFRMWQDHWLTGVGPAHFDVRFPQYRPAHRDLQVQPQRTHNDYLNLLVDWGVVGGVMFAGLWISSVTALRRAWPALRKAEEDPVYFNQSPAAFAVGACLGLVAVLVHSLFDYNLNIPANALVAVAWMALVTALVGAFGGGAGWKPGKVGKTLVILMILTAASYLGGSNLRMGGEIRAMAAVQGLGQSDFKGMVQGYVKVHQAEPLNPLTCYKIAELYRQRSWQGLDDYEEDARTAITWYEKAAELNPYDAYTYVGHAMSLDWLGRHEEAERVFLRANELDPNGYVTMAMIGWHYLSVDDNAEAVRWLERSISLYANNNFLAWYYLQRAKERLMKSERAIEERTPP